jgi:hypothetical protein
MLVTLGEKTRNFCGTKSYITALAHAKVTLYLTKDFIAD